MPSRVAATECPNTSTRKGGKPEEVVGSLGTLPLRFGTAVEMWLPKKALMILWQIIETGAPQAHVAINHFRSLPI
jgi:hypothetical protein